MKTLKKTVESKTKVRFQDCDPFNHLNNGSYINYFINHREDTILEYYGLDMFKIAKETGKSWVSSSNQIAYLKPAFLMETVVITSQLFRKTDSELYVEMKMYNEDKTQLKAVIWCGFTHYDLMQQKRAIHPESLTKLFDSILNPIEASTFEERLHQIKSKKVSL